MPNLRRYKDFLNVNIVVQCQLNVLQNLIINNYFQVIVPRQNLGFRPPRRVSYDREAAVQNGNGASMGAHNGGGNGAPRGDYSGPGRRDRYNRGNGGYGYGKGNGGYPGNGGYRQQQQQGGNVGGYYQQQRRPANDRYYRERSDSATVLDVEFPALPVAASARAAALASASTPTPAEGSAPASA